MYSYTKHRSCFSRHILTMTYSQMKRSQLRRDEDSVPANTRAKGPCVPCNVYGETETTVIVGAKEREQASSLSFPYVLSPSPLTSRRASSLFLPFRRTAPPTADLFFTATFPRSNRSSFPSLFFSL